MSPIASKGHETREDLSPGQPIAGFPPTQWSLVARAGHIDQPESERALADLCQRYWYPLYVYARRHAHDPEAAEDLIQDFFAEVFEKQLIAAADRARGRFRAFLLTSLKNFLINHRLKAQAAKRGGGRLAFSLDVAASESRYVREPAHDLTPEKLFDRQWAIALLDLVMQRLQAEQTAAGRQQQFETLKGSLTGESSSAALARDLKMTPEATRQAIHRLRKRYRELLRAEIAETLADPSEVEDELRALRAALE